MTAATLTSLPLTAGGALVGSLTRGGVWVLVRVLEFGAWTAAQFMRAPLAISAIIGVAGFSLLAGSNALYFQSERHPAPLFFDAAPATAPAHKAAPVMPAPRPANLPTRLDTETTGSLGTPAAAPAAIIGFPEVLALQQKLVALRLLNDDPDGIFGQRTAAAIRAFQKDAGLRVDGKLTPRIIAAVASAELPAAAPPVQQTAALPPVPIPAPAPAMAAPAPVASPAIAAPAPAAATPQPVPLAAVAAPAAPAAAPVAPPPADTFAANSLPETAAPPQAAPPAVAAAVAPERPMAREDLTATGSRVAMNSPRTAAAASGANLSAAQRLAAQIGTLPPEATAVAAARPPVPAANANDTEGSIDPVLISNIQRGLASLGFLSAKIDGVPGEGTAKAIRNFEVFYDYKITGLATPRLLTLLVQHGAVI